MVSKELNFEYTAQTLAPAAFSTYDAQIFHSKPSRCVSPVCRHPCVPVAVQCRCLVAPISLLRRTMSSCKSAVRLCPLRCLPVWPLCWCRPPMSSMGAALASSIRCCTSSRPTRTTATAWTRHRLPTSLSATTSARRTREQATEPTATTTARDSTPRQDGTPSQGWAHPTCPGCRLA